MSNWMTRPAKVRTQLKMLPFVTVLVAVAAVLLYPYPHQRGWAVGYAIMVPVLVFRFFWLRAQQRKDGGAAIEQRQRQLAEHGQWRGYLAPSLIGFAVAMVWLVATLPIVLPAHSATLTTFVSGFGGVVVAAVTAALIRRHGGV
jgi:hypothetical protein